MISAQVSANLGAATAGDILEALQAQSAAFANVTVDAVEEVVYGVETPSPVASSKKSDGGSGSVMAGAEINVSRQFRFGAH